MPVSLFLPPASLLRPLLVPQGPWSHMSLDFITDLPPWEGKTVILPIIETGDSRGSVVSYVLAHGLPQDWLGHSVPLPVLERVLQAVWGVGEPLPLTHTLVRLCDLTWRKSRAALLLTNNKYQRSANQLLNTKWTRRSGSPRVIYRFGQNVTSSLPGS